MTKSFPISAGQHFPILLQQRKPLFATEPQAGYLGAQREMLEFQQYSGKKRHFPLLRVSGKRCVFVCFCTKKDAKSFPMPRKVGKRGKHFYPNHPK